MLKLPLHILPFKSGCDINACPVVPDKYRRSPDKYISETTCPAGQANFLEHQLTDKYNFSLTSPSEEPGEWPITEVGKFPGKVSLPVSWESISPSYVKLPLLRSEQSDTPIEQLTSLYAQHSNPCLFWAEGISMEADKRSFTAPVIKPLVTNLGLLLGQQLIINKFSIYFYFEWQQKDCRAD